MERRTLLAVVLSFVVVYAYQAFFVPKAPEAAHSASATAPGNPAPAPAAAAPTGAQAPVVSSQSESAPGESRPARPASVVSEASEREVVVETPMLKVVFTNRGARLKRWMLKGYLDQAGQPVDLVPVEPGPGQPLPFSLKIDEGGVGERLNQAVFRATQSGATGEAKVLFEFEDASGLTVRKEFRFGPLPYEVTFTARVRQGDQELNPTIQWGPGLGDLRSTGGGQFLRTSAIPAPDALFHDGKSVTRVGYAKVATSAVHEGNFRFIGVDDHYFIAAAVNPGPSQVEFRAVTLPVAGEPTKERQLLLHSIRPAKPGTALRYYIGPKSFDALKAVDGEFVRAINFGIWAFISVPFLSALKWIHGYVGNWGWSIILLTLAMNIVMAPLRHKSVVSMRKMQELQPQLKAIQDRYADLKVSDPARQKMNTEVMSLYREKGVNPASGCIPMVLQFPFLFAFYSLLSQAVELRGAPFAFWIQDLSRMDPYYVTPLLMGVTMFWQQRLTPSTGDPAQQRMMMFMPVVFVGMFLTFPSGLAIYYFVQNVWAIGQQYFTTWLIGPPVVPVLRPPAERRIKSAGSGRTVRAEKKS